MHGVDLSAAQVTEVHRFVARRVANPADAADIAQQTLLRAWARLSSCRGKNFSAWLLTIARHSIVDHFRALNRLRFVESTAIADTHPALQTPPEAVLARCVQRERLNYWTDCIARRLRLEEQIAVLLANVYGYRDRESAAVLSMSLPSFKLLLHGARARLRDTTSGDSLLARETSAGCDGAACGGGDNNGEFDDRGPPRVRPRHRARVKCRLSRPRLHALRSELLGGLRR